MRKMIVLLGFCLALSGSAFAQSASGTLQSGGLSTHPREKRVTSHDPNFTRTSPLSFYQRKSEWRRIVDSTWGPGLPLAQKLSVFDYYSNFVRAHNPTFVYTRLNWDSVSAFWRSKITDSTSRGGFSAILSYLAQQLNDGNHPWACDTILYSTPLNPGTPILVGLPFDYSDKGVSHFGAGLTPLPDSSLLVYMVTANHPLGLEPGDIILGYEGVPWWKIIRELVAAEIPIVAYTGCSPSAREYYRLFCAGMNWHLFDTIDVLKYRTGQTVHLSTDTLISMRLATSLVNGAQLPVPGVPMPGWELGEEWASSKAVTYGIVQGTNIGYIYVFHHQYNNVGAEFNAAVAALAQTHGLIIDIRFDNGGFSGLNDGIARLTSYAGPTLQNLTRSSPTDLWSLVPGTWLNFDIPQDAMVYERPIAVLLGPTCLSYGDITARQLTYLDNVRFFGKSPMGEYTGYSTGMYFPGFDLRCMDFTFVDHRSPNTPLWGQEFPIDEHVWLTRDGVARGEDDVVKRALAWITATGVAEGEPQIPQQFALSQNYPNPFNPSTTIKYELPTSSVVRLTVYDVLGREVSVLLNDERSPGLHEVQYTAEGLPSGIYFYRLQAGEFSQTRSMVILR